MNEAANHKVFAGSKLEGNWESKGYAHTTQPVADVGVGQLTFIESSYCIIYCMHSYGLLRLRMDTSIYGHPAEKNLLLRSKWKFLNSLCRQLLLICQNSSSSDRQRSLYRHVKYTDVSTLLASFYVFEFFTYSPLVAPVDRFRGHKSRDLL
jgi:hypothetical protein